MLRDEMDNEVPICCFYAVIRNCHTPLPFSISLGLFACWNFLWSRMESVKLVPSWNEGQWLWVPSHLRGRKEARGGQLGATPGGPGRTAELRAMQLPWMLFTGPLLPPGLESWPSPAVVIMGHAGFPKLISLFKALSFHPLYLSFSICLGRLEGRDPNFPIARLNVVPRGP